MKLKDHSDRAGIKRGLYIINIYDVHEVLEFFTNLIHLFLYKLRRSEHHNSHKIHSTLQF